jgi:hypothetical protein
MRFLDLLRLGTDTLIDMALKGSLTPSTLWTALKGAESYRAAMAAGDVASEDEQLSRAAICAACPSRTSRRVDSIKATASYCGEPFNDRREEADKPTCGCLIAITNDGETISQAGKTMVASEQCPQKKWLAVPLTVNGQDQTS